MNKRVRLILLSSIMGAFIVAVFLAGAFMGESSYGVDFANVSQKPSWEHWFGTDWLGRDLFFRSLKGLSISLTIGTVASTVSAVFATIIGIIAASGSKTVDGIINWLIDFIMSIPHLILIILLSLACGKGMLGLLVGISATHWAYLARLIRGEVLQIKGSAYIKISEKLGRGKFWILSQHIFPHVLPQFIVGLILLFPHAILHEAGVSFLGFGLSPDQPAIGIILSESMKYLSTGMWWLAVFPGATLVLIVIMFERIGNNIKVLLDPYSAQE